MRNPWLRILVLLVATPAAIAGLVLGVPVLESSLDDLTSTYGGLGGMIPGAGEASDWLVKVGALAVLLTALLRLRLRVARRWGGADRASLSDARPGCARGLTAGGGQPGRQW